MRRMLRIVWAAWLLVAAVSCPAAGVDQQAVRAIVLRQAVAWNRHDAAAYSSLFTPDCDVVNIAGWWWKSRAEVHQNLARAFSGVFAHSTLTFTDVQVKFPGPDIAVAHAQWKMSGARMPPGMPAPDAGIQTLVLARQRDGKWLIAEFQNTLSRPEHPFPTPIPAAPGSTARGH